MLSKREQIMFYAALAILGLFVLNHFVINPVSNHLNLTRVERDELAAEVQAMEDLLGHRRIMQQRWQEMLEQGLCEDPSATERSMFQKLEQWSDDCGVNITTMTPSRNTVEVGLPSITFNVAGKGSLEGVCRLMYQLEETAMPIRIQSLTLGSSNPSGESLAIQMKLNVPYLDPSKPLTEDSISL